MRHKISYLSLFFAALSWLCPVAISSAEPGLVGHWMLQGDCRDYSGHGNHGVNHGVKLDSGAFDGLGAFIEVPASDSLKLGTADFALCAWVHTEKQLDDVVGDVLDLYDPARRRGITLSINASAGGFQSQGTDRHVYFGIDNAKTSDWKDCGRPSAASNYVSESMTVYKGKLYAATTGGEDEKDWRHVFRYNGGQEWIDCGQVGEGEIAGSWPADRSQRRFICRDLDGRLDARQRQWLRSRSSVSLPGRHELADCGQPSDSCTLNCVASFQGKLFVGGGPETWGVFTQDKQREWKPAIVFEKTGPRRCFPHSMAVFNGRLFTGYPVAYAFDGNEWAYVGQPVDYDVGGLQLYCFVAHQGKLCVGSWPEGKVAVYQGGEDWQEIGRVGDDGTEVNGLVVYNGKLYGGSLPRAEVCRFDGDAKWTSLKRFYSPDGWQPGIPYKANRKEVNEWVRLTSLSIFDGKLFASTGSCTSSVLDAPCDVRGKVFSMEAGKCASYDDDLGPGWAHLVATRQGGRLRLFVNGKQVAESSTFDPADFEVSTGRPLRIGFGQTDYFAGRISDVRIYNRALTDAQIQQLSAQAPDLATAPAKNIREANIVLASNASRIDRFAAAELQRCLTTALGWTLSISARPPATSGVPTFFVGSLDSDIASTTGFPPIAEERIASLKEDGSCLQGNDEIVALVGKGPRGGLYAVYEFLEKHVGIHWPEPGREHIPQLASLELKCNRAHNPALSYRGVALHGPCSDEFYRQIIDWAAKNRMNTIQFSCEVYDTIRPKILESILDRGLVPKIGAHSRQYFYPTAKYFPHHPEHFAQVKGKRQGDSQLCYSNHASAAAYADNVVAYVKEHPEVGIIGLWPSDGYGFCECDHCKATSTTDVLLDYVNDVSERVRAYCPQVKVEFLSYIHYTSPPQNVKPLPYVVPTYCEYWSRSQFHSLTEDRASNAKCREQLKRWVGASHQATVYSYYADDVMKKFLYNPVCDVVLADLRYYQSIGVAGNSVLMMNPQSWWANAPHMYAYAKASWDPTVTLVEIDDEYFHSLYGPAAKPMQVHQQAVRAMFDTVYAHGQTGEDILFDFRIKEFNPSKEAAAKSQFYDAVERARTCLAEANALTADPYILKRIAILDQDAQLMGRIYGILSESAGYHIDRNDDRKDRMRDHIASVVANDVAAKEDFRCKVLKSLLPHVTSVLGAVEAAKYDRAPELPPE